jgi:hypothetical protein
MENEKEVPASIGYFRFFGTVIAILGLIASALLLSELSTLPKEEDPLLLIVQFSVTVLCSLTWLALVNVITYIAKNINQN